MNLEIFNFKEKLIKDINESPLPVTVKQMAVQEILNQLNIVAVNVIAQERAAREAEKAGESNGEEIHKG